MNILKRIFGGRSIRTLLASDVCHYIDQKEINGGLICLRGWIFNKKSAVTSAEICFECGGETRTFPLTLTERMDVRDAYGSDNALYSGFAFSAGYKAGQKVRIYIKTFTESSTDTTDIAEAPAHGTGFGVSRRIAGHVNFTDFVQNCVSADIPAIPESIYSHKFDVIVPVYNGYDFLAPLLESIQKTKLEYRLILVNDASPDERVLPLLTKYAAEHENTLLINNKENLGFVQSVNKALMLGEMHCAIVNTDVFLPDLWLERLMLPIILDEKPASSTPFTTCGTICSFPDFCADNEIFMGLDVDKVDSVFRHFVPEYNEMPTGVGFCMGMNRNVIEKIGAFDADTFYKGYGEENDWCQRAIKAGFKNVHTENLFVYHKHGASFPSEAKKRYIERNLKLLNERHKGYDADVGAYISADPACGFREYAKLMFMREAVEKNIIVFDHAWGGGANSYSKRRTESEAAKGIGVLYVVAEADGLYAEYITKYGKAGFTLDSLDALDKFIDCIGKIEYILINELVSCTDIYSMLDHIKKLKEKLGAGLYMLGHDFYSCCPSVYLINNEGQHCFKPDASICENCMLTNADSFNNRYESMAKWREKWGDFLSHCDEITVFSENSKTYFMHWYPQLKNIKVVPHTVDYIPAIPPYPTDKDRLVIGILGNFMRTKGSRVVIEMQEAILRQNLNVDIVVVGQNLDSVSHDSLKILGRYKPEDIPDIFRENKIDIVFIASIWPETFSYTTQEVINMGLPVACFDIGAPAERISRYDKGLVIPEMTAEAALKAMIGYMKKGGANG